MNQTLPAPTPPTPVLPTNFWLILLGLASLFLFAITIGCFGALFCFISKRGAGVIAVIPVPITHTATPTKEVEFETRSPTTTDTTISVPESPMSTPPSSPPLHPSPAPPPISSYGGGVISSRRSLSEIESNMGASNTVEDEDETPVNTSLLENIVGINDWDAIVDDSHDHA